MPNKTQLPQLFKRDDHQDTQKVNCWYKLSVYRVGLQAYLSLYNFQIAYLIEALKYC